MPAKQLTKAPEMDALSVADVVVFTLFELLGLLGVVGNLLLVAIIVRFNYLRKPSFILIASLAIADVIHAVITATYFYPPIITKVNSLPPALYRAINCIDWIAWGITLSHMCGICIDRLIAIVLFQHYTRMVTIGRVIGITVAFWVAFTVVNVFLAAADFCCAVIPMPDYYTFGFDDPVGGNGTGGSAEIVNVYKYIYIPIEIMTMVVLTVSNPTILVRLYQSYKMRSRTSITTARRKSAATIGSVTRYQSVVDRGTRLVSTTTSVAASVAGLQPAPVAGFLSRDAKIFLQIIIVTVIFFAYMFNYYLFFYIIDIRLSKWASMLNSLFYSITHMINPFVYFALNDQMQENLRRHAAPLTAMWSNYSSRANGPSTKVSLSESPAMMRMDLSGRTPLLPRGPLLTDIDEVSSYHELSQHNLKRDAPSPSDQLQRNNEAEHTPEDPLIENSDSRVLWLRLTTSQSGLRATVENELCYPSMLLESDDATETLL